MIRPDYAVLTAQFSALGATPRQAGGRVAARGDSLRRAFQVLGVPRDSIWSSAQQSGWWPGRVEVVPGQQVRHQPPPGTGGQAVVTQDTAYRTRDVLEIRVHDLARLGQLIDTLLSLGITDITGPRFVASHTAEAKEAALRKATATVTVYGRWQLVAP